MFFLSLWRIFSLILNYYFSFFIIILFCLFFSILHNINCILQLLSIISFTFGCKQFFFPHITNIQLFIYVNYQSLPAHFDEFLDYFLHNFYNIIAASKISLKPHILSFSISVPKNILICRDWTDQMGEDLGILVHDCLRVKIFLKSLSPDFSLIEYLFVEIFQ